MVLEKQPGRFFLGQPARPWRWPPAPRRNGLPSTTRNPFRDIIRPGGGTFTSPDAKRNLLETKSRVGFAPIAVTTLPHLESLAVPEPVPETPTAGTPDAAE